MCFTAEETALIDGIIVSYFAPQSVSEHIRLRYFKTHKHLQEETIDRTDLLNIRSALLFLSPEFRDSVQLPKQVPYFPSIKNVKKAETLQRDSGPPPFFFILSKKVFLKGGQSPPLFYIHYEELFSLVEGGLHDGH